MTVTELAKELNVTQQAIYQKLRRRKIPLDSMQDTQGALTKDGETQIREMFINSKQTQLDSLNNIYKEREELREQIRELKQRNEELESRLKASEEETRKQAETIRVLTEDKGYLQLALQREQENQRQAMLLLAPPKKESVFKRIRTAIGGRNNDR